MNEPFLEIDAGDRASVVVTDAFSEPTPSNPNAMTTVSLEMELPDKVRRRGSRVCCVCCVCCVCVWCVCFVCALCVLHVCSAKSVHV